MPARAQRRTPCLPVEIKRDEETVRSGQYLQSDIADRTLLPEALHERVKERAKRPRRSMNNEVITILEEALMPSRRSAEEAIARAEALNRKIGETFDPDLIERGKREGRA